MSTRDIYWGDNGGRCVGLTTLPPSLAKCLEIWEPHPPGTLRVCPGLKWDSFTLPRAERASGILLKRDGILTNIIILMMIMMMIIMELSCNFTCNSKGRT
jgi:hypothetical protein